MQLKSIYTPDVVFCSPATTVVEAAALMRRKHTGDLVVVDESDEDRVPLGVITDRDIVVEVIAKGLDPSTTAVRSLLRTPVVIAHDDEDSADAVERMRVHGIRRLPVVDGDGKLAGIITLDDVLKGAAANLNALADIVGREQSREHRSRR